MALHVQAASEVSIRPRFPRYVPAVGDAEINGYVCATRPSVDILWPNSEVMINALTLLNN